MRRRRLGRLALAGSVCAGAFATGCQPPPTEGWRSELVSVGLTGAPPTSPAGTADITADGTMVLLTATSAAMGFPGPVTAPGSDLFLRDLRTGTLTRITTAPGGSSGSNATISEASFSPDDRAVLFVTGASNLGPTDTNARADVYLYDIASGAIRLISTNAAGTNSANSSSNSAWFSPDGQRVAFTSQANDLGPADANATWDVYVRDLASGATHLVSANASGSGPGDLESTLPPRSDGASGSPFSSDGRFVAFRSNATDLTDAVTRSVGPYVRDLATGTTRPATVGDGGGLLASAAVTDVAMSPDGDLVVFTAIVPDSTGIPVPFRSDLLVSDLAAGTLERIATGAAKPIFSPDGRTVAFSGPGPIATGLPDTNGQADVYLYDVDAQAVRLVSTDATGAKAASGQSASPSFSGDGRSLAFVSNAPDVVPGKPGTTNDLYLHDIDAGSNRLVSVNRSGNGRAGQVTGVARLDDTASAIAYASASQSLAGVPIPRGTWQAYVASVTPYPAADLSVRAEAPDHVGAGEPWSLTVAAGNGGPDPVDDVSLSVIVSADVESVTAQAPPGVTCTVASVGTDGRSIVGCTLGTLDVDESFDVVVSGGVRIDPVATEITATAVVGAVRIVDLAGGNGVADATSTVDGPTPPTTVTIP